MHITERVPGEPLIRKRYAEGWRWKQAKEVHVYSLMADVPGVPSVVSVDAEDGVTVMTLVPGSPLSDARVPPECHRDVYRQIGALLRTLHQLVQPEFGYVTTEIVDPEQHNTAYMSRRFLVTLDRFRELGGDPATHRLATERVAERAGLFGLCSEAVLCHNDLHEGNVLVEPDGDGWRVSGFVDVENAVAADPMTDLAKTVQYELSRSPAKYAGLLEGYGPLPRSGLARIELYRLHHALELWNFFRDNGTTAPLNDIAFDIRQLAQLP
ncbi:phosphotransferase family protein [Actinophytocola glycyrrhizae]|uniref:Phosphotransferase family protein n=1 Tax=Actinophytocola glycyrrhizae TaxID=2044873 RepID=A0ABV9RVJ9_9PSEU